MENSTASKDDIMMIIEKINSAKIDTENQIRVSNEKIEKTIKEEISSVNAVLHELRVENERLRKNVDTLTKLTDRQKGEIDDLKGVVKMHRNEIAELQQRGRIDSVKIYGLTEQGRYGSESAEETGRVVRDFLYHKLGVNVRTSDISIAHRLQANERGNRPRTVIVKFTRRTVKHEVLKNRKKLKGSPVTIAEDLSNTNMKLFHAMRELVGNNAWTWEGKVLIKVEGVTKRVTLENELEITQYIQALCDRGYDPRARPRGPDTRQYVHTRKADSRRPLPPRDAQDSRGASVRGASLPRDRPAEQHTGPTAAKPYNVVASAASSRGRDRSRSHSSDRFYIARDRSDSRSDRGRERSRRVRSRVRSRQRPPSNDRYRERGTVVEMRDRGTTRERDRTTNRSPVFDRDNFQGRRASEGN